MQHLTTIAKLSELAEARRCIGTLLRRPPFNTEASFPVISRWARSIGERNPFFLDSGYASRSRVGTLVAPPCWLYSVDNTAIAVRFPDLHAIYGGTSWEFYRWVRSGERIVTFARLLDVQEKASSFAGRMIVERGEVLYVNGKGERLARAVSTILRTPRDKAREIGKYSNWERYKYTREDLIRVEDSYDAEQIRGSEPRYWEDVKTKDTIQPVVKGPLSSEDMLEFIGATCPTMAFRRFAELRVRHPGIAFKSDETGQWESWDASILDERVAHRFGFPFAHDAGIDRIAWIGSMLTNWMGDDGFLRSLDVRLILPSVLKDTTWCKGRVTAKSQEGNESLVNCEVWCENQRGWVTAKGTAVVSLPSRGGHHPLLAGH